jgi:hypothetical protein
MEQVVQRPRRWGPLRSIAAGVAFAGAIAAVAVLLVPTTAFGKSACAGFGTRIRIAGFSPNVAKAGSSTLVTVWGSHLNDASSVFVGPKGRQTQMFAAHMGDELVFSVPSNTVSGPIEAVSCSSTAWSTRSLRV